MQITLFAVATLNSENTYFEIICRTHAWPPHGCRDLVLSASRLVMTRTQTKQRLTFEVNMVEYIYNH